MSNRENQIWGVESSPSIESIQGLVIPALGELAIEQVNIAKSDLRRRQEIVGGLIDYVGLTEPEASLVIHDEGKLLGLPFNHRATALLFMHNRFFRNRDFIAGDALLIGPADEEGDDTSLPDELHQMLTAEGQRCVEVKLHDGRWHPSKFAIDNWYDAYVTAFEVDSSVPGVENVRVRIA